MKRVFHAALLIIAAVIAVRLFLTDEATVINKMLREVARESSYEGVAHPLERLAWAKDLSDYATDDCRFMVLTQQGPKQILAGRSALREKLIVFRSALQQFAVAVSSPRLTIDGNKATVLLTAQAIGREPGRSDYFKEEHELELELKRSEGRWRIARAQNTKPYEGEWLEDEKAQ